MANSMSRFFPGLDIATDKVRKPSNLSNSFFESCLKISTKMSSSVKESFESLLMAQRHFNTWRTINQV